MVTESSTEFIARVNAIKPEKPVGKVILLTQGGAKMESTLLFP